MDHNIVKNTAPNLCILCIDQAAKGDYQGRLYHLYAAEAIPFDYMYAGVRQIDSLCDQLDYPQSSEQLRSFNKIKRKTKQTQENDCHTKETRAKQKMSKETLTQQKGKTATFVIHVMHRQNATWQGSVTWAEKDKKANFRSTLELIKLIDGAVEESMPEAGGEAPKDQQEP